MKILLDESLPKPLAKEILNHDVATVVSQGWSGKKNGELLRLAKDEFNVFVTADQNLQYQQNIKGYKIAIVALVSKINRMDHLKLLIPEFLKVLSTIKAGEIHRIS